MKIILQVCVLKDIFRSYSITLKNIVSIISRKMRKLNVLHYGRSVNTGYIKVYSLSMKWRLTLRKDYVIRDIKMRETQILLSEKLVFSR